jgi:hypothetical protein
MAFSYTALDNPKSQIRLIEIQNGISTGALMYPSPTIICTMKHYDLNTCPGYRALSYTWGSSQPRTHILIDGKRFSVSAGLGTFLERARHIDWLLGNPGYIWIDQICIEQDEEKPEKNAQVSIMGEIYQKALEVLVWLGPAADSSSQAMTAINSLDQNEIQKHQNALRALFRRPYWNRLWIVQEVLRSRAGKVLCGKSWLAWTVFTNFIDTMLGQRKLMNIAQNSWPMPDSVLTIFLERETPIERRSLSRILDMFGLFLCKDPRDRVFGLQSLVPVHARVSVDYSISRLSLWSTVVSKVGEDEGYTGTDWLLQFARRLQIALEVDIPNDVVQSVVFPVQIQSKCSIQ